MKRILRLTVISFAALALVASCVTPKKVLYLQDMEQDTPIEIENKYEAVIVPYDELNIIVSCAEPELAEPFNLHRMVSSGGGGYLSGGGNTFYYLVDVNGNIQFPVLGEIHVAGLTRLKLQELLKNKLLEGGYLEDPFVMVRFQNFKIFFLGSDGGKSITIQNERCTFLEALAMSGDLDNLTSREKIGVLRYVDGKMVMRYLDPRSTKVFNDPFFLLQQNDFIITESLHSKYIRDEFTYYSSWVSLFTSFASLVSIFAVLIPLL